MLWRIIMKNHFKLLSTSLIVALSFASSQASYSMDETGQESRAFLLKSHVLGMKDNYYQEEIFQDKITPNKIEYDFNKIDDINNIKEESNKLDRIHSKIKNLSNQSITEMTGYIDNEKNKKAYEINYKNLTNKDGLSLRKIISNNNFGEEGILFIGKCYKNRGGFFEYFELDQQKKKLNCFMYALEKFEECLLFQKKINTPIKEMISLYNDEYMDKIINEFFTRIKDTPQDGDLVVYKTTKEEEMPKNDRPIKEGTTTHAGIYRENRLMKKSVVESKWGAFESSYAFQHDFFFCYSFYGDLIQIYRLKDSY